MASQHMQIRSTTVFSAAIEHLESLIDSLKRGTIFISLGEKSILLKPSEPVEIELDAEIKLNEGIFREKIAFKLKWEIRESWLRDMVRDGQNPQGGKAHGGDDPSQE
jgi:amphi-Trp domain-containing protein